MDELQEEEVGEEDEIDNMIDMIFDDDPND